MWAGGAGGAGRAAFAAQTPSSLPRPPNRLPTAPRYGHKIATSGGGAPQPALPLGVCQPGAPSRGGRGRTAGPVRRSCGVPAHCFFHADPTSGAWDRRRRALCVDEWDAALRGAPLAMIRSRARQGYGILLYSGSFQAHQCPVRFSVAVSRDEGPFARFDFRERGGVAGSCRSVGQTRGVPRAIRGQRVCLWFKWPHTSRLGHAARKWMHL